MSNISKKIQVLGAAFSIVFSTTVYAQYAGTGNETDGANHLLTYPDLLSENVVYYLGGKRKFVVEYGDKIDASTFQAVLNGADISKRFRPYPGTKQQVFLKLEKGDNVLRLKVADHGNASTNRAPYWDTDDFNISLNPPQAKAGMHIKMLTGAEGEEMRKKIYEQARGKSGK